MIFNQRNWDDQLTWYAAFNYVEGVLWFLIGAFTVFYSRKKGGRKQFALASAAALLFIFGVSDWLEASREATVPAWLWVLKIACGAGLFACRFGYLGWDQFHWKRSEFWGGLFCLGGVVTVMLLQQQQGGPPLISH
ncbi:MAG: hypothetical protein ACR2OZ_08625 [Verrucomicrobiales bacterium]